MYYIRCESMGFSKCYNVNAYTMCEAEKEALHKFKAEFPMMAFYAKIVR